MPEPLARPLFDPASGWKAWWEAFGLRAPFSGDVTESIDAAFIRTMANQLGFININTSRAGDPGAGEADHRAGRELRATARPVSSPT
jgi:hypothetical protein